MRRLAVFLALAGLILALPMAHDAIAKKGDKVKVDVCHVNSANTPGVVSAPYITAVFNLGYSHPIRYDLPEGIDARIEKTRITISGIDKELVGQVAADIRGLDPPEPYKGKGIRYVGEYVKRKAGKAGAAQA